ncbi:MAG: hypothetical protein H5T86_10525, partial [Armatimonadetes bacterium]|nr:hypothetical protein [Armatimonadota bacterium]
GRRCRNCGALMTKEAAADHCIYCGGELTSVELSEALVEAAQNTGAAIEFVPPGSEIERLGGVAALLRF